MLASEAVNDTGQTYSRIEQRKLDSHEEGSEATVEWLPRGEGSLQRDFGGFTADARHFMRVAARGRSTGDWSAVEQLELLDLEQSRTLQIHFSRESPAPPALVAKELPCLAPIKRDRVSRRDSRTPLP